MAILGRVDQILAPKGVSMTIAPLGAVCAVLFATPSSPAARVCSASLQSLVLCAPHILHESRPSRKCFLLFYKP